MKFTTKTIHSVNYNDFDEAINDFLEEKGGKPYEFEIVAHHELMNDVSVSFDVGEYDWAVPTEKNKQEILNGKLGWRAGEILEWMHAEGKIPSGEYLVKISW